MNCCINKKSISDYAHNLVRTKLKKIATASDVCMCKEDWVLKETDVSTDYFIIKVKFIFDEVRKKDKGAYLVNSSLISVDSIIPNLMLRCDALIVSHEKIYIIDFDYSKTKTCAKGCKELQLLYEAIKEIFKEKVVPKKYVLIKYQPLIDHISEWAIEQ